MSSNNIFNQVERLNNLIRTDTRQAGIAYGLQPVQMEILHYLSICNRFSDTPMAVTEYLGQTKGTVSQTIKVLENKGLLSKSADSKDKRVSHLKLSTKGTKLLKQTIPTSMFKKACDSLSSKKQADIESALKQLLVSLLKSSEMKTFGVCSSCRYNGKTEDEPFFCHLLKQPLVSNDINLICWEHESDSVTKV